MCPSLAGRAHEPASLRSQHAPCQHEAAQLRFTGPRPANNGAGARVVYSHGATMSVLRQRRGQPVRLARRRDPQTRSLPGALGALGAGVYSRITGNLGAAGPSHRMARCNEAHDSPTLRSVRRARRDPLGRGGRGPHHRPRKQITAPALLTSSLFHRALLRRPSRTTHLRRCAPEPNHSASHLVFTMVRARA